MPGDTRSPIDTTRQRAGNTDRINRETVGDLFDSYAPAETYSGPAWDEMFESPGIPRAAAHLLHDALQALPTDEFESRCAARDRGFRDRGITFQLSGEERPFPLDLIPRVIAHEEWKVLEAGVIQR